MKSLKQEFPNQVYSLNTPVTDVSTEVLKTELKSLRHIWMINLKLNHKRSIDSLMKCMTEIDSELKARRLNKLTQLQNESSNPPCDDNTRHFE